MYLKRSVNQVQSLGASFLASLFWRLLNFHTKISLFFTSVGILAPQTNWRGDFGTLKIAFNGKPST